MTEAEWLASDDLDQLLEYVCELRRVELGITDPEVFHESRRSELLPARVYPRKRRLFACACCRRLGTIQPDVGRAALDVAERFADGVASEADRIAGMAALEAAGNAHDEQHTEPGNVWQSRRYALMAAGGALRALTDISYTSATLWVGPGNRPFLDSDDDDGGFIAPAFHAHNAWVFAENDAGVVPLLEERWRFLHPRFIAEAGHPVRGTNWYAELLIQCELLRDIFGNPFRPVIVDPAWLTPTVISIAQGIYEERAFDRMPILADALEDAGCTNVDMLNHCRLPGEHVRGCWPVDLVLGKE